MAQLIAWIGFCFVVAILLRRRPAMLVAASLGLWIVVPSVASSMITTVDTGTLSFAPSTWLIVATFAVQLLYNARAVLFEISHRILVYLALALVLAVALLATKTSSGGSGLVLFADQIAAPIALFVVACVALRARFGDIAIIRNTIVALATAECVLAIVQWSLKSILFYEPYYAKTYWYNAEKFSRFLGTTDSPLTLSLLICVAVPLVAGIRRIWLQIPILMLLAVGVIITQSRTGVAVVVLGIIYVILTSRIGPPAKLLSLILMVVAGVAVLSSSLTEGVAGRVDYDNGSAAARSDALTYFFEHWGSYFFTGGGIGSSYRFAELGGLITSLESSILMYAIDIGVIFSLLYFGTQLAIVLRSARRPGCRGVFLAGLVVVVIPQTFSALASGSLAGVLLWTVLAMAASLPVAGSAAALALAGDVDGPAVDPRPQELTRPVATLSSGSPAESIAATAPVSPESAHVPSPAAPPSGRLLTRVPPVVPRRPVVHRTPPIHRVHTGRTVAPTPALGPIDHSPAAHHTSRTGTAGK